jgi:hypothetical protein
MQSYGSEECCQIGTIGHRLKKRKPGRRRVLYWLCCWHHGGQLEISQMRMLLTTGGNDSI